MVATIIVCSLYGAPSAHAQPARPAGISLFELFGVVIRKSKWATTNINVCWENAKPEDEAHRQLVKKAVADTWEKHSVIRFQSWGDCQNGSLGIRIRVADKAPRTEAIGRYLNGRPNGMTLNFSFRHWGPECSKNVDFCIAASAAHEFGHALGFTHEQNRNDAPLQCRREKAQGSVGDYKVTKYDAKSIMNYCNPHWLGDGQLSALDIQAVQTFYGG